ncbi:MAG: division/cell wall cluster transcriptional repressor MraZ [Bacilli bacterium]|nr:division/cell wall cluster transcriptional repressor MraZ [Bacilli bacterium]
MFMGEYCHNLDDKSRIVVPANFRFELGDKFIIAKGIEKCLYIYSKNEWESIVSKFNSLPFTRKDVRTFMRVFFAGANNLEMDKSGRVVIASNLKEYANIKKECVIIGANDRIEVWAKDEWENFVNTYQDKISDIAENLFEDVSV